MKLLETELIRKYFGCVESGLCVKDWHEKGVLENSSHHMAYRILQAMQEPIKAGELVLERFPSDPVNEWHATKAPINFDADLHAGWLRLPDSFQPKRDVKECGKCDECGYDYQRYCRQHTQKPPSTDGCCFICRGISTHTGCYHCPCKGKPDPVEEKIKEIFSDKYDFKGGASKRWNDLRELVELARRQ